MSSNESFSERYGTLFAICFASIQLSVAFVISIVSAFHVKKCYANERAQATKEWERARSMSSTVGAESIDVISAADDGKEDNDAKDTVHSGQCNGTFVRSSIRLLHYISDLSLTVSVHVCR